ncbi:PH-interacting protein-like [Paramacrobiotus metropolitanus]|uniref:PH-interacting protein-like n=1 Tax=Paramacrobiotus metropolitanus TaxID=2943436 RepID=UPI00244575F3|nr:PH-interacting protein-like [Paramacrobiotus metropolitanus]
MSISTDPASNKIYRDIWILLQELGAPDPFVQDFERDGRNKIAELDCRITQLLRKFYGTRAVEAGVQAIVAESANGDGLCAQAVPTLGATIQTAMTGQPKTATNVGHNDSVATEVNPTSSGSDNRQGKHSDGGAEHPTRAVSDAVTNNVDANVPPTLDRVVHFVDEEIPLTEAMATQKKKQPAAKMRVMSSPSVRSKSEVKAVRKPGKTPLPPPVVRRWPGWLTEMMPRPFPYFPQIGDVVYYYRQEHAVYIINWLMEGLPATAIKGQMQNFRDKEELKIVDMKFVNVSVQHTPQDAPMIYHVAEIEMKRKDSQLNEKTFTISFHEASDTKDFLVLEHHVLRSRNEMWEEGSRVKSLFLENGELRWYKGTIDAAIPDAAGMYHMLKVRFDGSKDGPGCVEPASPWDLRLLSKEEELAQDGAVITSAELHSMTYEPTPADWNYQDPATETKRILKLLNAVSKLPEAAWFVVAVDLKRYPDYAVEVAYPVDLSTIQRRVAKQFYRRKEALIFDFKQIAINSEKYNGDAPISMQAHVIADICTDFTNDPSVHALQSTFIESVKIKWSTEFEARKKSASRVPANARTGRPEESGMEPANVPQVMPDEPTKQPYGANPGHEQRETAGIIKRTVSGRIVKAPKLYEPV